MFKLVLMFVAIFLFHTPLADVLPKRCSIISNFLEKEMLSEFRGRYREAEFYIESGLDLLSKNSPFVETYGYFKKLGVVKWHLGKVTEAQESFNRALTEVRRPINDETTNFCEKALEIISNYQEAKKARLEGRINESTLKFSEAVSLALTVSNGELAGKCLRQLAVNFWEQNRLEDYLFACIEALRLSVLSRNRKEAGICCNNLGLYYWKKSSLSLALFFIKEGLDLSRVENAAENVSICLSNLGVLYFELGDFTNSFKVIKETIAISEKERDLTGRAANYNNMGLLYKNKFIMHREIDDATKAIGSFKTALAESKVNERIKILNNLSQIYSAMGHREAAFQAINSCIQLIKCESSPENEIPVRNSLGFYYLDAGAFRNAAQIFDETIASSLKIGFRRNLWESYFGRGECWLAIEQYECAIECFMKAIAEIDQIKSEIYHDLQKVSYRRDKSRVYERMIEALLRRYETTKNKNDAAAIVTFISRTKGEALRESIEKAADRKSIYSRMWSCLKDKYFHSYANAITNGIYQIQANVYFNAMRVSNRVLRTDLEERTANIEKIVAYSIRHRQKIVEYFFSGDTSLIISVQNEKITVSRFMPEKTLKDRVRGYIAYLSSHRLPVEIGFNKANSLFTDLVAPYIDLDRKNVSNLIIIPAGCLCELPFETLITGGTPQKPEYLVHHFSITYMPSISIALMLEERKNNLEEKRLFDYVAFGDPRPEKNNVLNNVEKKSSGNNLERFIRLPSSKEEVLSIGRQFKKRNRLVYTNKDANEDNFRKMSGIPTKIGRVN